MLRLDWNAAINSLRETVPQTQFQNWFKPVEFIRSDDRAIVLGVPSRFHEEWIRTNYADKLSSVIRKQVGQSLQLEFEILERDDEGEAADGAVALAAPAPPKPPARPNLRIVESEPEEDGPAPLPEAPWLPAFKNPYVELEFNGMAHRCARLFAQGNELGGFGPLVILGGVGMGKTHLLTEIGHWIHESRPYTRIRYTSAESFANEFFEALRSPNPQTVIEFKRKYREHTDCLLFDGIDGLGKKTKTQEELLHVFNEITGRGGKVVFTTSLPAQRLDGFIEPVKSRILSGIVAEIKYPAFGDKVSLLQRLCHHYRMDADPGVLRLLADQGQKDIRELIGTLVRMHLQAKIEDRPLDTGFLAREGVNTAEPRRTTIEIDEIVALVEHNYGVCRSELMSKSRKGSTTWARQVAMYLARHYTLMPLEQIGKYFGRDHATVIHAFQKVTETMESHPTRRFEVEFLRQKLQSRAPQKR